MPLKKKKAKKQGIKRKPAARKKIVKKKIIKKKPVKKAAAKRRPAAVKKPKEKIIGTVTHYFPHVQAAVIKLKAPLAAGDTIKIKGHTTDFIQQITSMQIDRVPVDTAKKGQEIGVQVSSRVRQHDLAYKV